jgi:ribosome-associated toxin RatA of RatAB toxin-antitoxin module
MQNARFFAWIALLSFGLAQTVHAEAPKPPAAPSAPAQPNDARHQRLEGLDDHERALLQPLMENGPVALIEFAEDDMLPQVLVADLVDAPAAQMAKVISQPRDYPTFMPTLDNVEVLQQTETQTSYKWTWQTGVLFLEGENHMTSLPPPPDHPELGYRITVNSQRGALGEGRLLWRVFPVSEKRSMVMLAMRVDMREANFVMRQLDAAARSVNRSVNLALCYVMLLGAKRETERRAGVTPAVKPVVFGPPKLDLVKYKGILGRADLLLMELTPTGLGKLTILGRTGLKAELLRPVMLNPETFGKALVPGSYTRVTKQEGNTKTFEWGINLPLIGTSGTMDMSELADGTLHIDATEGALKGGKWRFSTPALPGGESVVVGYAVFDIKRTTWLIEKIASLDPVMGHGLAAASELMVLRALRRRAHDEVDEMKARSAAERAAVEATTGDHPAQSAIAARPSAIPANAAPAAAAPTKAPAPVVETSTPPPAPSEPAAQPVPAAEAPAAPGAPPPSHDPVAPNHRTQPIPPRMRSN